MPALRDIETGRMIRQSPDQSHCNVEGCKNRHRTMGYCNAHYKQVQEFGEITRLETIRKLKGLTIRERFEENTMPIPFCGCWMWIGEMKRGKGLTPEKQYGVLRYGPANNVTRKKAHRVAWELFRGEIPNGLKVLHKCDTPWCVNPDHLFLGTHQENMQDMAQKGRAYFQRKQRAAMKEGL